jgi:hypothetical protein
VSNTSFNGLFKSSEGRDQPIPKPISRQFQTASLEENRHKQTKVKSSCSLRKKSLGHHKRAFFSNDKAFKNIQNTLLEDR